MPQQRPLLKAISKFLDGKHTVEEIAQKSGHSTAAVYGAIHRAGYGAKVRWQNRWHQNGKIRDVFVPPHVHEWLVEQCPQGLRVDEMITAIVTDAYLDAQEAAA